jgi:hypothetical protein
MHATGKADQDDDQVGDGTGSSCLRSPIEPWPHVREYRLGRKELTYWGVLTGRCMDLVTGMVVTAGGAQVRQGSRHELVLGIPACNYPFGDERNASAMSRGRQG